jgi:arginine/lysine/ornithine decarboxylase
MASIDSAVDHLIKDGERILNGLSAALSEFYKATESLEKLSVIREEKRDSLKIVIMADKIKGKSEELVRLLRERRIEPEMVAPTYVLCMAGLGDTRESLEKLSAALLEIDKMLSLSEDNYPQIVHTHLPMRSGMKDPFDRNYREASFENASGMISAEYLWAYPPGIPIITPGEIFDDEIIGMVKSYYESGLSLYSDKRGRIYCSDTLCVISD